MGNMSEFILSLRKEKGYTQKFLAEKLNVTVQAVSKWETGKNYPDVDLYIPICELFGITITELIQGRRISPEELSEETAETIVETVSTGQKKIKYSIITCMCIVFSIITISFIINSYKINAQKLGDLISFTYSDNNFVVDDLFLTVSNDYKTQQYMGGTLKINNKSILDDVEKIEINFCYDNGECYEVFNNIVKDDVQEYMFYTNSIDGIYEITNIDLYDIKYFESILHKTNIKVSIQYFDGNIKNFELKLAVSFILHNHSDFYKI
ncbi:MAG: helix-turn-helix transcriptional regulator [Bacilli bacterium]|nr:helix-turn-helix transcriptional regulator [Bacilli bacterium]